MKENYFIPIKIKDQYNKTKLRTNIIASFARFCASILTSPKKLDIKVVTKTR